MHFTLPSVFSNLHLRLNRQTYYNLVPLTLVVGLDIELTDKGAIIKTFSIHLCGTWDILETLAVFELCFPLSLCPWLTTSSIMLSEELG
jgi:hypothetical protein